MIALESPALSGARLQVRAIFGCAQIVVPETWRVSSRVVGIGGIGDSRSSVELHDLAPHLTIEGVAIFGGFGVTSDLSEDAARGLGEAVDRTARRRHRAAADSAQVAPAT